MRLIVLLVFLASCGDGGSGNPSGVAGVGGNTGIGGEAGEPAGASGSSGSAGTAGTAGSPVAGSGGAAATAVEGSWALDLNEFCVQGLTFKGADYELDSACVLSDSTIGMEVTAGWFTYIGTALVLYPQRSSLCTPPLTSEEYSASVNGNSLAIVSPSGVAAFRRINPGGGSGTAAFGCFAGTTFYRNQVQPVPGAIPKPTDI